MARALADVIRESWQGWVDEPVDATVFGTRDADEIAAQLDAVAHAHLGARIVDALGYHASVGCTALVRLDDGREVAIKVFQPHTSPTFLTAVVAVQQHLHAAGFPAAEPLAGPVPVAGTHATIDARVVDPGIISEPDASARRASAAGLARLLRSAASVAGSEAVAGLAQHPMAAPEVGLWPRPHSPLFSFDLPTPRAAEIDALGQAGRDARDADPAGLVIAHCDWTLRNVRIRSGPDAAVVAVFDWDSLHLVAETRAVGQAAQTWCATGEAGAPAWPDARGVATFVADYERARERPFRAAERRAIGGAALYNLAYTARCEAALQARWPDHEGHPHQALDLLSADGDRLLSL